MENDKTQQLRAEKLLKELREQAKRNKALMLSFEETVNCADGQKAKKTMISHVINSINN